MLVHGDSVEMKKLQDRLTSIYKERIQILTPRNCQLVRFNLVSKKSAKIIGSLAKKVIEQAMMARERIANSMPRELEDVAMNDGEEQKGGEGGATGAEDDLSNYVTVDGVIIKQDFDHLIMEENEVDKYTPLQSATMEQTLYVPYQHDIQVLGYFLHSYYAQVDVEFPSVDTTAQPD